MKKTLTLVAVIALFAAAVNFYQPVTAQAQQEIKEINILSRYLGENHDNIKTILRMSRDMQREAMPFTRERHRNRFRFEPKDDNPRQIMVTARRSAARFKLINGILSRSDISDRELIFSEIADNLESMSVFSKRAIRAIRDNNYALYLASAKGIENEVFALNEMLHELELAINASIYESDSAKESL